MILKTFPKFIRRLQSPLGRIQLASDGTAITSVDIESDGELPFDYIEADSNAVLELAEEQLNEYFAGTRKTFEVPLQLRGTQFQHAVWEQLAALRWGEVTSYGEIGVATGRPTAGRAVGGAIGANPMPIFIPCHRVLAGNARVTGYSAGAGVPTKVWLLTHEGIQHRV